MREIREGFKDTYQSEGKALNGALQTVAPRQGEFLLHAKRIICCLAALALFVWAHLDSRFRDAEGFLQAGYCLPIATGVALIILGCAVSRPWSRFAAWLALAVVGQATALQMIDAGHLIHYQHYRQLPHLLELSPWLLVILVGQLALTLFGLKAYWRSIRRWLGRNFKTWQLLAVSLSLFLTSAAVSRDARVYLLELFFAASVQAINLANIVVAVCALPNAVVARLKRKLDDLFGVADAENAEGGGVDRFALLAAFWVMALAAVLSVYSYERHPHLGDEVAYLYHARYLAAGMLTMPPPPIPEAFNLDLMDYDESRWFCAPPPGWPVFLAIGVLFGAEWLVNPALAGLSVVLAYYLIRELYDRRTARLATVLLCVSPWHSFLAMSYMTHTAALACALAAAVSVIRARRTGKMGWAFLSGGAAGMVGIIRPLEGVIVAVLIGLWVIGLGGRRLKVPGIAAFVLGAIVVGAATLPYNKLLTGSPTTFPIMAYTDKYNGPKSNAFGFGPERGMGWPLDPYPGHGPLDAMINTSLNSFMINVDLFGWSVGSLVFIAMVLFALELRRGDYLMLWTIAAIFIAHFFYWYSGGPEFGARYWYLMLIPCVALTARGIQFLEQKLEGDNGSQAVQGGRSLILALSLCALALITYFPWRAIDKYHHFLGMRPDIRRLAGERNFSNSLVLIRGEQFPDFASAAVYNPINLNANAPIYAFDVGANTRSRLLHIYADRLVWIIAGPSITGVGFKIIEGPLPAQELSNRERRKL